MDGEAVMNNFLISNTTQKAYSSLKNIHISNVITVVAQSI